MEKLYSSKFAQLFVKRTAIGVSIDVYQSYTILRIHRKNLTVEQLQSIIDQIFFFDDVDYHVRFTDLRIVVYCNSSSVCDKYIAN